MDDFAQIALTAFGTLAVTIVVALVTWWIQSSSEHAKWVRERRLELYTEIVVLGSEFFVRNKSDEATGNRDDRFGRYERMHSSMERLHMLGPTHLWQLGAALLTSADAVAGAESDPEASRAALERMSAAQLDFALEANRVLGFDRVNAKKPPLGPTQR